MSETPHVPQVHDLLPGQASSVPRMLLDRIATTPDREAYRYPVGDRWESVTWAEAGEVVRPLAAGLLALGIRPEERVAIASSTRIEWLYADLAIACAGAATTTVYPSTGPEDVGFILRDSDSRVVFAEDDVQVEKLRSQRARLPGLDRVVTFDGTPDGDWVLGLADLRELGLRHLAEHPDAVERAVAAVRPEDLATLIYTSGTTGQPKGVELPHRCWTYIGVAAEGLDILTEDDLQFLWLPLSHSFGKMLQAVQLQVGFPTAVDGRMDRIVPNLAEVRPTFMAGPPRIFEKVHAKVVQGLEEEGGVKAALGGWAFGVGDRVARARVAGRRVGPVTRAEHALADRLVLAKVRERLGGRIRFLISGSAALSPDVAAWFHAAGMVVMEGYGMTETSAGACIVRLEDPAFGKVGPPVDGTEVRIAEDGEILLRGPSVMRGYHRQPEATAEVLDAEGWLATGDVGELDEEGRLRITDRKKDLIKTSGGKYIAPQAIEMLFKAVCPLASQMVVHAEGRNYATALITLDSEALAQWAAANGFPPADYADLAALPEVRAYVQASMDQVNARLNRWETIKDFRILDRDLTVEDGEVTPSMKVRRKVVETAYRPLLDEMYTG
ncbi:MAG: long-chain fatty acid--CoA ligase [Nocardioides sp.]|nr:long-chain fatty acid--CoA ligase [Nocardioidaceae bacterium]MCB8956593.1 long-chain fatty acid--CoA ligase [Nocardioides sp.]